MKEKAEKLEKLPYAKKVHYVQLGNLAKLQQKGVFTFTVPDMVRKITARAIRVEAHSEQTYNWYGTVQGEEIGHVIIDCENGRMTGSIAVNERSLLADGMHQAGQHSRKVDSQQLRSGVYFYRLTTKGYSQTKKLIVTR